MRKINIIGTGQIKVSENWEKSLKELAGDAGMLAMADAEVKDVDGIFIGNMMAGSANNQVHLGAMIADWLNLKFKESFSLEAACASGSAAFRNAVLAIAAGQLETALVIGVEKMTDSPSNEIAAALATAADGDLEADMGVSFVALNALIMQRYMYEYKWATNDFAAFSINAHANAVNNPYARFTKAITLKTFEESPMVCDPINLMDASSIGDGAAAVVISAADARHSLSPRVVVAASAAATDTISLQNRKDPLWLYAAEKSSREAYRQAGITPYNIDVFEYHDAFSIMAALSLESNGFCERGQAPRLANEMQIGINGRIPVATMGGLKARGHPVGATGIYQIVEVVQQLAGKAGKNQVPRNFYGMTQNIGGSGSNVITHIFKRE